MILNNCTTCGRKPKILTYGALMNDYFAQCSCGKKVYSAERNTEWSSEVAADMWNRANPQEEKTMHSDYINYLADQASKHGLKAKIDDWGNLDFGKPKISNPDMAMLALELIKFRIELTEFYKKRLEPGVKV